MRSIGRGEAGLRRVLRDSSEAFMSDYRLRASFLWTYGRTYAPVARHVKSCNDGLTEDLQAVLKERVITKTLVSY
jgi:hypothetical protein